MNVSEDNSALLDAFNWESKIENLLSKEVLKIKAVFFSECIA